MKGLTRLFHHRFFIKLFNWEYWSHGAIYGWVYPVWFFLGLRARSFFFFSASNPLIRNGGLLNESKKAISQLIPAELQPKTSFFSLPTNVDIVLKELSDNGLEFPLVGKPDVGGRGRGVKALKDIEDVKFFLKLVTMDFHIQEYVSYKNEIGLFYYRYPDSEKGVISGIVRKEFLSVTGDGKSSVRELLLMNKRALVYLHDFERIQKDNMEMVLPEGEVRVISPYGNHARGAMFLDDSALIDETLTRTMDQVCKQIPEFYFGRLDIRFDNWEDLKRGRKFCIIEVNGAGAEPTHMYDPRHSVFFAWKEIVRHWIILWRVSVRNHKRGVPYMNMKDGLRMFSEDKEWSRRLDAMKE